MEQELSMYMSEEIFRETQSRAEAELSLRSRMHKQTLFLAECRKYEVC